MTVGAGVRKAEKAATEVVTRRSDPWTAVMAFGRSLATIAEAEALLVVAHGWGMDVWTVVNRSSANIRQQLADKQWNLMQVFPDLDVDFHILDRRDEPLDRFVRPTDYDMFVRLRSYAHT